MAYLLKLHSHVDRRTLHLLLWHIQQMKTNSLSNWDSWYASFINWEWSQILSHPKASNCLPRCRNMLLLFYIFIAAVVFRVLFCIYHPAHFLWPGVTVGEAHKHDCLISWESPSFIPLWLFFVILSLVKSGNTKPSLAADKRWRVNRTFAFRSCFIPSAAVYQYVECAACCCWWQVLIKNNVFAGCAAHLSTDNTYILPSSTLCWCQMFIVTHDLLLFIWQQGYVFKM